MRTTVLISTVTGSEETIPAIKSKIIEYMGTRTVENPGLNVPTLSFKTEVSEDDMYEIGKIIKEVSGSAVAYFINDPEDIIMNISYNGDRPNWETLSIKD